MKIRDYDPSTGDFPQGDIDIFPIPENVELVAGAVEIAPIAGRLIIQEGEATGHHHAIELTRNFRANTRTLGDPTVMPRSPKLRKVLGGRQRPEAGLGTARLFRDPQAIAALAQCGELTRTDLAIGILVVEGGAVVLAHEEHDGIRLPHAWTDAAGKKRRGRYYVGRQIESAGAEERVVVD
jgi:hypothetical protein